VQLSLSSRLQVRLPQTSNSLLLAVDKTKQAGILKTSLILIKGRRIMTKNIVSQYYNYNPELDDTQLISRIVDCLYPKLLDDYRINRFFFTRPIEDQARSLKILLSRVLSKKEVTNDELFDLLEDFFTLAFSRTNAKPSLVGNQDFAFLLDIVGGKDIRPMNLLCPAHSFLMKFLPDDEHYDVFIEHLSTSLEELAFSRELAAKIIAFAEIGRNSVLGRGDEILQAA
jgi:hemoglobin